MAAADLCFGDFRLRPEERQLLRGGTQVALTARAFDVLLTLAQQAGGLVSKDALLQRVWAGVVVEENNLAVQVGVLRKLLGSEAIVTVPGRGYRFALPLQPVAIAWPARRGNLPAQAAPLLGRDETLMALQAGVRAERLVSVVGAGGIGKSRIALAAGAGLAEHWRDGVWWLELAGLADPTLLVPAVAQALGTSLAERDASPSLLARVLAERQALLIIDNCEHLLEAVAALVQALLAGAPGLHVLATSQEPLRLPAEQQFRLDPLAVPADAQTPQARSFGALALLVARVRSAAPSYVLSDADLPQAIDLCRRLDGLPLAIELAAARVPLLGLRTVHDRLDERFRLLTAGARTALRRHQTLRAALAWSHGLLDDTQRTVFMRLGAFSGGFTMALAQALCTDAQLDEWAVLEAVAALVDKSLVVAETGGSQRLRLLESARAFALEELTGAGHAGTLLRRHAQAMLGHLRRVDDANMNGELRSDEFALQVLPELDNLRAAYAWAAGTSGDRVIAIGLAAHVGSLIDYSLEFVTWMLDQLPHVEASGVDDATAARFWRGLVEDNVGGFLHVDQRRAAGTRAVTLYSTLNQPKRLFFALFRHAAVSNSIEDLPTWRAAVARTQALLQPDWAPAFHMRQMRFRGHLARMEEQLDVAEACFRESLRQTRQALGDWRLEVIDLTNLADLLWQAGRPVESLALLDEILAGLATRPASDYELIEASEIRLWLLTDMGRIADAVAMARTALPAMRRMPRFYLSGTAHLLLLIGRPEYAAQALGAYEARRRAGLEAWQPFWTQRFLATTRAGIDAALAPEAALALQAAGERMGHGDVCGLLAKAVAGWDQDRREADSP